VFRCGVWMGVDLCFVIRFVLELYCPRIVVSALAKTFVAQTDQ
jgi:hypothetical protein